MKKQDLPAKNFFAALLFSLALATLIAACGKTDDKTEETGSNSTALLTQKPWVLVKIEYRYDEQASWQEAPIPECQKDDTRLFKKDNTMEHSGGTIKCDANEKQKYTIANWKWNDAKTAFSITDLATKFTTINKVIKLTESEQMVTYSVNPGNGGAIVYYKAALTH